MKIKKGGKLGGQERNMDKTLLQCRWDRVSIRERRRRTVRGGEEDRQTRSSQIGYFTVVVAFHLLNINIYKKWWIIYIKINIMGVERGGG